MPSPPSTRPPVARGRPSSGSIREDPPPAARPSIRRPPVNHNRLLKITSLLSLLLLTLHVTDDIVRGISKAESSNIALVVLVILLYGTLVLVGRPWGYVITFVVGLFAAINPVMHMRGAHYPEIAASAGGYYFVWTLWALGAFGGVTMILSVRGLWGLRRNTRA